MFNIEVGTMDSFIILKNIIFMLMSLTILYNIFSKRDKNDDGNIFLGMLLFLSSFSIRIAFFNLVIFMFIMACWVLYVNKCLKGFYKDNKPFNKNLTYYIAPISLFNLVYVIYNIIVFGKKALPACYILILTTIATIMLSIVVMFVTSIILSYIKKEKFKYKDKLKETLKSPRIYYITFIVLIFA